ncbi:uncharacterized protein LOC111051509 [Nilaparvata lugens]|uniref:uncharacterized protein LOC111051509 n=1 Tax=Nilaparvata lugens TaxID=108931 RepID=UPI00193DA9CD|nr:uncharacterized protein LOC111051509 [Nilaparvata lugens]
MMARANTDTAIKPYDLFILDHKSFKNVEMECTRALRKYVELIAYDRPHNSIPFFFIITVGILEFVNNCMVILTERENKEKFLMGIKDLFMISAAFSIIMETSFNSQKAHKLLDLIEMECLVSRYRFVGLGQKFAKIEERYNEKKAAMERMYNNIFYVVVVVYFGAINRHLLSSLFEGSSELGKTRDWPTPFVYWCPAGYNTFTFFLFMYTFQSLMLLLCTISGGSVEIIVFLATEKVLADFETIVLLLDKITTEFPDFDFGEASGSPQTKQMNTLLTMNEELKRDMSIIVQCHQALNRNFKDCAEIPAFGILMNTFIISLDTIFNVYLMLKAQDLITSINYAAASFFINLIGFFRFHTGHGIVDQNDVFRQSVANLPWTNKPAWFKQMLIIMMGRANIDTEIKPYNIFVLNHKTFKNIMTSVFTYANFFYTRHSMS